MIVKREQMIGHFQLQLIVFPDDYDCRWMVRVMRMTFIHSTQDWITGDRVFVENCRTVEEANRIYQEQIRETAIKMAEEAMGIW